MFHQQLINIWSLPTYSELYKRVGFEWEVTCHIVTSVPLAGTTEIGVQNFSEAESNQ
jgi:hypothetical protein